MSGDGEGEGGGGGGEEGIRSTAINTSNTTV